MNWKRSIKVFGLSVPIYAIASIAMIGVASASLVGYLSNTITANATVESPLKLWIWDGGAYVQTAQSYPVYGGETVSLWIKSQNYANVVTNGNTQINVVGGNCNDFTDATYNSVSFMGYCTNIDGTHAYFAVPTAWSAGLIKEDKIDITFKPATLGTYTFEGLITPV